MKLSREWAMPPSGGATFDCPPIRQFVERYLMDAEVSVDPFARDSKLATLTNDLNPNTEAQEHMKAADYLEWLSESIKGCDLVIFDPPYSLRQTKELYEGIGVEFTYEDSHSVGRWIEEKDIISGLLRPGGVVLHFGWNTNGMGKKRGYDIEEILIVAHGSAHHDTLCMAERKLQGDLWDSITMT